MSCLAFVCVGGVSVAWRDNFKRSHSNRLDELPKAMPRVAPPWRELFEQMDALLVVVAGSCGVAKRPAVWWCCCAFMGLRPQNSLRAVMRRHRATTAHPCETAGEIQQSASHCAEGQSASERNFGDDRHLRGGRMRILRACDARCSSARKALWLFTPEHGVAPSGSCVRSRTRSHLRQSKTGASFYWRSATRTERSEDHSEAVVHGTNTRSVLARHGGCLLGGSSRPALCFGPTRVCSRTSLARAPVSRTFGR